MYRVRSMFLDAVIRLLRIYTILAWMVVGVSLGLNACATPTPISVSVIQPSPTPVLVESSSAPTGTVYTKLYVLPSPPSGPVIVPTAVPTRRPDVAHLRIPAIQVDTRVIEIGWHIERINGVEQAIWDNASYAAGHLMNTRNPGEGSNIVLSGHNNIEGKVFANLWKLKVGDEVILATTDQSVFKYRVTAAKIVDEKYASPEQRVANARYIEPTPPERVTLISCYPPTNNTNRVIVVAEPEN